jgi:hypothetical protein
LFAGVGIMVQFISTNRTLRRAVNTRTQELKNTVNQLSQANEQLKVHDKERDR